MERESSLALCSLCIFPFSAQVRDAGIGSRGLLPLPRQVAVEAEACPPRGCVCSGQPAQRRVFHGCRWLLDGLPILPLASSNACGPRV